MAQEQKTLDLDALVLIPPRIVLPDGRCIVLRDLSTEEVITFTRRAQELTSLPAAQQPMHVAALLASLAETDRADELLDELPLIALADVLAWIQTADAPIFTVPKAEPLGMVTIGGQPRAIRPLTLRVYRQAMAAIEQTGSIQDLEAIMAANLSMLAAMIEGITVEELRALPHARRRALERFLQETLAEAARTTETIPTQRARPR
jgi:hypothetical protein